MSRGAARVVNCGRVRANQRANRVLNVRQLRSAMDRFVARVYLRGFQSMWHSYTLKQGTSCFRLIKLSCDRACRFSYS